MRLDNDHVSRNHALIQGQSDSSAQQTEFRLVDLGSSNGTLLNGRRVSRPATLRNGDVIEIGGSRLVFENGAADVQGSDDFAGSTLLSMSRRVCWLMVADIAGSTRMARELPPEEGPKVTGTWFKTCREVIERHGGHMNQYLGDGFFCYWEDAPVTRNQVLEALRELAVMQEKSAPEFRVVVHRGQTVLGSVPTLTTENLHGPQVNFVFRMEKIAAVNGDARLCSEDAWEALRVPSVIRRESAVGGYDGIHVFHVPDLTPASTPPAES